jgi:hypothetical protein
MAAVSADGCFVKRHMAWQAASSCFLSLIMSCFAAAAQAFASAAAESIA